MINKTLQDISIMLSSEIANSSNSELLVKGVSTDSRSVQQGNLFIPLSGEHFDGHAYVEQAIAKGAVASLWQKDRGEPPQSIAVIIVEDTLEALQKLAHTYRAELSVRIIGVTGSNGKTSTKDLLASVLATTYKTHKTKGNLNNHIGLPLTILSMPKHTEMAVLEMGMSGRGEIEMLSNIAKPEVVVITNVGEAHLMQLGSREEIAHAKLEICAGLCEDGLVVYNGDEPLLMKAIEQLKSADIHDSDLRLHKHSKLFRFGGAETNDYYPLAIMFDGEETLFTVNDDKMITYTIPMLGQHNVMNALAAIAVGKYMGVTQQDIITGLQKTKPSGMRVEVTKGANGVTILNDAYNSSPTALRAALQLLKELKGYKQKIAVIGDMLELGVQGKKYHVEIGSLLRPEEIDYVFTYGELSSHLAEEASQHYSREKVQAFDDKSKLIAALRKVTRADDVVLVKGSRGMKLEEVVEGLAR